MWHTWGRGEVITKFWQETTGRPRCRWQDNIKMDLRETGIDGANCIQLV
jgi:hypothetical protein